MSLKQILIYGVTDHTAMVENLAKAVDKEIYFTKTLSNNTVRMSNLSSQTYIKLIRHNQKEKCRRTFKIKQHRAYKDVIRELHHPVSINEIKNELNGKGHLVRNIINVKHRATKEPLLLFFVDLEQQNNNKEIYQLQFLQN
jgi:hypothetical protein